MRTLASALYSRGLAIAVAAAVAGCAGAPLAPLEPGKHASGLASIAAIEPGSVGPALTLGKGDAVTITVYGRPELTQTTTVAEDGSVTVPLAGAIHVLGLSPPKAGQRIAAAFRLGKYLVDPQVTVALAQSRGYQVSVLGAVRSPGRFAIEPRTTMLDALAQAGGVADNGGDMVVLLRPDKAGNVTRYAIELKGLSQARSPVPTLTLRGGDSLFVPPAEQFYIYGEVKAPNMYRLERGMTVVQAISRGGGITPRGSNSRIEIKRRRSDGTFVDRSADLDDEVQADDVVRVKERIF